MAKKISPASVEAGDQLQLIYVKVKDLSKWDRNPKKHDLPSIKQSFIKYGFKDPPKWENVLGGLVEGNGRFEALTEMEAEGGEPPRGILKAKDTGEWCAPVLIGVEAESKASAEAYAIDHNNLVMVGSGFSELEIAELWVGEDYAAIIKDVVENGEEFASISDEGLRDIEKMFGEPEEEIEDPGAQIDKAEELREKWQVESGQLWQLGEHKIICGDCTDEAVVDRLMGGERAILCATSPPYSDLRDYEIGEFDWLSLANGFFDIAVLNCHEILINLGLKHKDNKVDLYWLPWLRHAEEIGWPLYGWYVWDQLSGMPGQFHGRLARSHEFVFHFSDRTKDTNKWVGTTGESLKRGTKGKRFRQKDGSLKALGSPDTIGQLTKVPDSVIRIRREMARGIHTESHPAVFSIEFAEFFIKTWTNEYELTYDPFLGSGTTLIACERLGRKARGIEIEPKYIAVTLERWAEMTGKTPELIDG